MRICSAVACLGFVATAKAAVSFKHGDSCGVKSTDFLNYDYRSDYLVAGEEGCTLGEDTGCFCAPDLEDGESLSEWKWQCNYSVNFGPNSANGKVCPDSVPVAKDLGDLDVVLNRRTLQDPTTQSVSCDTAIHPTGRPGDEVCPYSSCDVGGDHSAICACIDLAQYGLGDGMEWICMHATCSCNDEEEEGELNDMEASGSASIASTVFTLILGAVVAVVL